jgi:N-acetylmuramoyl-L-alanine amidase
MKFKNGILIDWDKPFKIDLIPISNRTSRPRHKLEPKHITIHNTANPGASAAANSNYVDNAKGYVSWHFTVGNNIVFQELPINESAWHAGDGSKGEGNRQSIAIEIAEVEGAYETAVAFIRDLLNYLDFDTSQVFPHKHWSGKNCPRLILPKWDEFISEISEKPEVDYESLYRDTLTMLEEANEKLDKIRSIL